MVAGNSGFSSEGKVNLKEVYQAADAARAELVRGLLESEGIAAVVQGAELQGSLGPVLAGSTLPGVYVRQEDVTSAREIIDHYEHGEQEKGADWVCPTCGEHIEGQFSSCWKCGTERPVAADGV